MPPRKHKADHRSSGGGKHVSTFEEVKARNNGEQTAYEKARASRIAPAAAEESDDDDGEKEEKAPPARKGGPSSAIQVQNPNAVQRNEEKNGIEITRRQREEMDKVAARRRYEELHKAGKTDEAKADLARLAEAKKRREEAATKRAEDEAAQKQKEAEKGTKKENITAEQLRGIMGGESRSRGDRSKKEKENDKDDKDESEKEGEEGEKKEEKKEEKKKDPFYAGIPTAGGESAPPKKKTDGTIESCRAAEDDFM